MSVYIFDAVRTPRGKGRPDGSLAGVKPAALVRQVLQALARRNGSEALAAARHLTLGCVTQTGVQGGHLALSARIQAGLSDDIACLSINNFCVSGLSAIADAARRVAAGEVEIALAGGVESMSQAPFLADGADYYSDMAMAAQMGWAPVGLAADLLATVEGVSRDAMDQAVLRSHQRAARAWAEGRYAERVVPVLDDTGAVLLDRDENIRDFGDGASLARLGSVFAKAGGEGYDDILRAQRPDITEVKHLHSVAHCPPIADGAAMVLLGSLAAGRALGLQPVARIRAVGETAGDHVLQLTAGFTAMDLALARAGLTLNEVGVTEFMEAFAVAPVVLDQRYGPDPERVNPNGGHLAMGHPMGATGAVLATTLVDDMIQCEAETGLVVATGGVGVGAAIVLERA